MASFVLCLLIPNFSLAQITATFPNGATNPHKPTYHPSGSMVNQSSLSRLISINGVDDFCLFGPPEPGLGSRIGNIEEVAVAYCSKARNGARIIPDGTITSAHFVKTPLYVQVHGFWDGTRINIPKGDMGGELDPHGIGNLGNPIGGNVTSNVSGSDVFYEEWMSFVSYTEFCFRVCIAQTSDFPAALQCEHELDLMGCEFVMAVNTSSTTNNSFTSCEGEPAAPPGLYPQADGSISTFRQRYTGSHIREKSVYYWTVGQTITPSEPAFFPKTSNCVTYSTISNGIDTANYLVPTTPTSALLLSSLGPLSTSTSSPITATLSSPRSAISIMTSLEATNDYVLEVTALKTIIAPSIDVLNYIVLLAILAVLIYIIVSIRRLYNRVLRLTQRLFNLFIWIMRYRL